MNKKILGLLLTVIIVVGVLFGVQAAKTDDAETKEIKKVIEAATLVAPDAYRKASLHLRQGTLAENRAALRSEGRAKMQEIYTPELASRLSKRYIDDQADAVLEGPQLLDNGIISIDIKEISISFNEAQVTASVRTYFVDRVERDGKYYHDRMEGAGNKQLTLIKLDGKWKISKFEAFPDFDSVTHTVTPE